MKHRARTSSPDQRQPQQRNGSARTTTGATVHGTRTLLACPRCTVARPRRRKAEQVEGARPAKGAEKQPDTERSDARAESCGREPVRGAGVRRSRPHPGHGPAHGVAGAGFARKRRRPAGRAGPARRRRAGAGEEGARRRVRRGGGAQEQEIGVDDDGNTAPTTGAIDRCFVCHERVR